MEAKSFRLSYDEDTRLMGVPIVMEYVDSSGFIRKMKLNALIDTGATKCCINKQLAKTLNFISIGNISTETANGIIASNVHIVNIVLPEGIYFDNEEVIETDIPADFIIGFNILKKGDFLLSHIDNKLVFSFRIPPLNDGRMFRTGSETDITEGTPLP